MATIFGIDYTLFGLYVTCVFQAMILSFFLVKDNKAFRLAETIVISLSVSNLFVLATRSIYYNGLIPLISNPGTNWHILGAMVVGSMVFGAFWRAHRWTFRWPIAITAGVGLAVAIRAGIDSNIINQIKALSIPLVGGRWSPVDNIVTIVFALGIVTIFIMTKERTGTVGTILARVQDFGRILLMVVIGSGFANQVMSRFVSYGGRLGYFLKALGILP